MLDRRPRSSFFHFLGGLAAKTIDFCWLRGDRPDFSRPAAGFFLFINLPEAFNFGIFCPIVDLLPLVPIVLFAVAFIWQSAVAFR
jgi:hypothetical protein